MLSPGWSNSAVQFYRIIPEAIPPMPADASALGTLPFAAYQYCEAIRTASSFGWYIFPMADIHCAGTKPRPSAVCQEASGSFSTAYRSPATRSSAGTGTHRTI